jgi:hypothetical protein
MERSPRERRRPTSPYGSRSLPPERDAAFGIAPEVLDAIARFIRDNEQALRELGGY